MKTLCRSNNRSKEDETEPGGGRPLLLRRGRRRPRLRRVGPAAAAVCSVAGALRRPFGPSRRAAASRHPAVAVLACAPSRRGGGRGRVAGARQGGAVGRHAQGEPPTKGRRTEEGRGSREAGGARCRRRASTELEAGRALAPTREAAEPELGIRRRRGPVEAGAAAGGAQRGRKEKGRGSGRRRRTLPPAVPPGARAGEKPVGAEIRPARPVEAGLRPSRRQEPWPSSVSPHGGQRQRGAEGRRWRRGVEGAGGGSAGGGAVATRWGFFPRDGRHWLGRESV